MPAAPEATAGSSVGVQRDGRYDLPCAKQYAYRHRDKGRRRFVPFPGDDTHRGLNVHGVHVQPHSGRRSSPVASHVAVLTNLSLDR